MTGDVTAGLEFDATVRRQWFIALGQSRLHLGCAAQRVDNAGELDQEAVAGGLDEAAVVLGDFRIDEFAPQRLEAFERAFLVRPHQPRIPRDIGGENRCETAGLAHSASPVASRRPDTYSSCCCGFRSSESIPIQAMVVRNRPTVSRASASRPKWA